MASDSPVVLSIDLKLEELFRRLVDFGKALLDPPASTIELLRLLEEFELFLSGVQQGREETFLRSLGPSKKALIGNQLLRHADTDVQIMVLSCISEITRITAPEWPYEESEMKEFFLPLLQSLKRLSSMDDRHYVKVVSILETVAGTKSCMIMLDLYMDIPILEMCRNFLTSIQLRPSPVFWDMVTIMTTLLVEYAKEGIPTDLLTTLLTSVKMDRKDVSPFSWAMGVQILQYSAAPVRPFLTNLVQSLEIDLNDYAEIVASICQNAAQVETTMGQELAPDSAAPNGQLVDGPSNSLENNSATKDMDNNISIEQTDNVSSRSDVSPLKDENSLKEQTSGVIEVQKAMNLENISRAENDNGNNTVPQNNNDGVKVPEKRERKPNSLFRLEEGYPFAGTFETGFLESSCGWKNYKRRTTRPSDRKNNTLSLESESFGDEKPRRKRTLKKKDNIINQHDSEQKQLSLPSPPVCGKRSRGKSASPANCDQESVLEASSQFAVVLASHLTTQPAPESQYEEQEVVARRTYGEKLVGRKIKVWWPMDQKYYEGRVKSFNLSTMVHTVSYDDGDVETLSLMGEIWKLVKEATLLDGQKKVQGPASSSQKKSVGPSSKRQKENNKGENIPEVAGPSSMEELD